MKKFMLAVVIVVLLINHLTVKADYEEELFARTYSKINTVVITADTDEQIEEEIWLGELEMLAILVEAEAGNQDFRGKRLVADVVLNRVESDDFPNTITDVIYQDNQFSTIYDGAFDKAGWNVSEESFNAVWLEANDDRLDNSILYFTAGKYGNYGSHAYSYGNHYFCY